MSEETPTPRVRAWVAVIAVAILIAGGLGAVVRLPAWRAPPTTPTSIPTPTPTDRWVSGDMHLHSENAQVSIQPARFLELLEENDLDVGVVHIWGVRPHNTAIRFKGQEDFASTPRILHYDLEVSSFRGLHERGLESFGGYPDHVIGLNLPEWRFPRRLFTKPIVDWVHAQGAVAGVAHAGLWGATPAEVPPRDSHAPIELPACLALGQELFLSTEDVKSEGFFQLYYGLLDCGFRVPLSAGSDYPVAPGQPGSPRTLVRLPAGTPLTYANWVSGIRHGRTTIAANAHDHLALRAGTAQSGDALELAEAGLLELEVDYRLGSAGTLELVVKGEVLASEQVQAGAGLWRPKVTISDSTWIVARGTTVHTGPLYVIVAGRPIRASVSSARRFVEHLDRLLGELDGPGFVFGRPSEADRVLIEEERRLAKETYELAREAWRRIEEECRERERLLTERPR